MTTLSLILPHQTLHGVPTRLLIQPGLPSSVLEPLMVVGLLPTLTPTRRETRTGYLARLAYAGLQTSLGDGAQLARYTGADARGPHELSLTVEGGWSEDDLIFCADLAHLTLVLHPHVAGSLLAHLSASTTHSWGVYTARDALHDATTIHFQGSEARYWQALREELQRHGQPNPTRQELQHEAAQRGWTPRSLNKQLGFHQVHSARTPLTLAELTALAQQPSTDIQQEVARGFVQKVVSAITHLNELNTALQQDACPQDDAVFSSTRRQPICQISTQAYSPWTRPHLWAGHTVAELYAEAQAYHVFRPNLFVRILTLDDAHRATRMLRALERAWLILRNVISLISDDAE